MSVLSIKYESHFMNLVYSGKSLQEIVDEGAAIIGTPIRFSPENRIEYAICSAGYPQEDIEYISKLLMEEGSNLRVFLSLSRREKTDKPFFAEDTSHYKTRIFCHVMIGSRYFGNLSIPQIDVDLHTVDMDCILLLSKTIALSCAVSGTWGYDFSRNSLFQRILSGTITNRNEIMAYLGRYAELEGKRFKLVCARIPEGKEPVVLQTALQRGFPDNPVVIYENMTVMLADVTKTDFKPRQMDELRNVTATYGCTLGVSMAFSDILQCREQMICLSEHPKMIRQEAGVFDYADNKEYMLLFSSRMEKNRILELIAGKLMQIRQYDRENGTGYYETICTYLNCSYHIQRTADEMHAHKNTLLYRIARIQDLFGVDLRSNRDIYMLNLALSVLSYWGEADMQKQSRS